MIAAAAGTLDGTLVKLQLVQPLGGDTAMNERLAPVAKAEMLIRKPVGDVFQAFVDPAITSKFWFSDGDGTLETGKQVTWTWKMYNFSVKVHTKAVEKNKRILVEWAVAGAPTTIEWRFEELAEGTFVSITNTGFRGEAEKVVQEAIDSTEGFAFVLAGAKALLEHNVRLNLVPDRFPQGLGARGR
jgi:uncharacterized protein YndB with AHSA1/START domain